MPIHRIDGLLIETDFDPPPIPKRSSDWRAWIVGEDEETRTQGHGATEVEAIKDLMQQIEP